MSDEAAAKWEADETIRAGDAITGEVKPPEWCEGFLAGWLAKTREAKGDIEALARTLHAASNIISELRALIAAETERRMDAESRACTRRW